MLVIVIKNPETYYANTQFFVAPTECEKEVCERIQSNSFNPSDFPNVEKIQFDTDEYRERRVQLYNGLQNFQYQGQPLRELFQWNGINLLQFISDHFFTSHTGLIDSLAHLIEVINIVKKTQSYSDLHFIGHLNENEQHVLEKYKSLTNVAIRTTFIKEPQSIHNTRSPLSQNDIFQTLLLFPKPDQSLCGKVLLFTNPRNQRIDSNGRAYEVFYEGFNDFFNQIGESPCRLIRDGFENRLDNNDSEDAVKKYIAQQMGEYSHLGFPLFSLHFASNNEFPDAEKYLGNFLTLVKKLVQLPEFITLFDWGELNLLAALPGLWVNLFTHGLVGVVPSLVRMRRLVAEIKPKAVFCTFENDWLARAIIVAAQQEGIPTFGLQHGKIFSASDIYYYNNTSYTNALKHTIPRFTFVWGEYFKNILTRKNDYPSESVVNVGCDWRVFNLDSGFNDHNIWLDLQKKRLLLLTGLESPEGLLSKIHSVFPPNEWQVLIKPHPADKEYRSACDYLKEKGYTVNVEYSVLHECIKSSDVVISPINSSVVQEVLFHKRPLVTFKLNNLDLAEYREMQSYIPDIESLESFELEQYANPWGISECKSLLDNAGYGSVSQRSFTEQLIELWGELFPNSNQLNTGIVDKSAFYSQLQHMKDAIVDTRDNIKIAQTVINEELFSPDLKEAINLFNLKKYQESIATLLNAVREVPNFWEAYLLLSHNFYKQGYPDKAIEVLKELLKSQPEYTAAQYLLREIEGTL